MRQGIFPLVFPDIPASNFLTTFSRWSKLPQIQALVGPLVTERNGMLKYSWFPPLLCCGDDTSLISNQFLNECLFMVRYCLCLLSSIKYAHLWICLRLLEAFYLAPRLPWTSKRQLLAPNLKACIFNRKYTNIWPLGSFPPFLHL